ncbi:MAG: hypothetical protein JWP97_4716 [Labilithrix sp.]|nr:hypothetical protein [Labilithrix sp.]
MTGAPAGTRVRGVTTPGVDFFRIDRSGSTRMLLVIGTLLVAAGASAIGAHLVHRLDDSEGHAVTLLGGLSLAAGLVLSFGALAMILFENVYLAIHDSHLLLHDNGAETKIPWNELASVDVDAKKGVLALGRANAAPITWFAGRSARDVGARIEEARRKGAHGLLRVDGP